MGIDFQTDREKARWEAHIKMERAAQEASCIVGSKRAMQSASGNQERAPVHASLAGLAELISMLEKQSEGLIDRLTPVSRPASGMTGDGCEAAQEPQCSLDDALNVMSTRVQSVIDQLNGARHRLCI